MAPALIIGFRGRPVPGSEADRIEGLARGFDSHLGQDPLDPEIGECQPVDEGFGDRLDGEGLAAVADLIDMTIHRRDGDAEPLRVGAGQFRDIGGEVALAQVRDAPVQRLQVFLNRGVDERLDRHWQGHLSGTRGKRTKQSASQIGN